MNIPYSCKEILLNADGKALATYGEKCGVHVVPVSSLRVVDEKIVLVNYFLGQTLQNIENNPKVALSAWKGLIGYQFKVEARYETSGKLFTEITEWIKATLPEREVKGILILTPTKITNISAGPEAGKEVC